MMNIFKFIFINSRRVGRLSPPFLLKIGFVNLFLCLIFSLYTYTGYGEKTGGINYKKSITKIAFGSCSHQDKPQPVLELAADTNPDVFIYLGDNVYNNSYSAGMLRKCYRKLGTKPEFIRLKKTVPILATWDDHDYGWNDSGRDYPYKHLSKKYFLEFFGRPDPLILRHEGIYYSRIIKTGGRRIHVIMLDTRTFRDKLNPYNGSMDNDYRFDYEMDYSPHTSVKYTILGGQQWRWLEKQLRVKADLRIIATSIQFAVTHNGYEAWANFPHEQKRMINLIRKTSAGGVIFFSGDVHYAEISIFKEKNIYPVYDITSSGITSAWDFATPNGNRIDGPVMENNFGLLTVKWDLPDPEITMQIYDVSGDLRINRKISLSALQF
jgi:alkaline phosphatase D